MSPLCRACGAPQTAAVEGCLARPHARSLADEIDEGVFLDLEFLTADWPDRCCSCSATLTEVHHFACPDGTCTTHWTGLDECGCDEAWLAEQERQARPSMITRLLRALRPGRRPAELPEIMRVASRRELS